MAWVAVAMVAQVSAARMLEAEANGAALLLYDVAGTIYATAAICPHHAAWLSQGSMSGELVDCPRHQGRFHIPTGRQERGPECLPLRTNPVRVDNGRVFVAV
jgi:nitrite reductase/ring-hydroxylating ferredoxin subunit